MPDTRGVHGQIPPPTGEFSPELRQRLDARLRGLRLGATCFALLGGLAVYYFLAQKHMAGAVAAGLGLVYAIFVRIAVTSLARDWLVRAASHLQERERDRP